MPRLDPLPLISTTTLPSVPLRIKRAGTSDDDLNRIGMFEALTLGMMMQRETYRVQPFLQDIGSSYTRKQGLPSEDVRALTVTGDSLWAATAEGLARLPMPVSEGAKWQKVTDTAAHALVPDNQGGVYAALSKGVQQVRSNGSTQALKDLETLDVKSLQAAREGGLWCLTSDKLYRWQDGIKTTYPAPAGKQLVFAMEDTRGRIYVSTEGQLERLFYRWENGAWKQIGIKDNRGRFYDDRIRVGVSDPLGHLWLGVPTGIMIADGDGWWYPISGRDGLPYENVLCLALAPNGDLWVGTSEGACRLSEGRWTYFWGKRWMPGNQVRAIALDTQGNAWLATNGGISRIEARKTTLSEKSQHYEAIVNARHNRYGFVTGCALSDPDNLKAFTYSASDNDGLWTALYCAAECYRYAVTKDPQARELARKSMRAIMDLERLTGIPGFPARAIMHKGEKGVDQSQGEWHESPVDPNFLWKGDTSSDELDGHYYIYPVYYDLVADTQEKEELRAAIRRITDHLLEHNYQLIDLDGKPTRWAIFDPPNLNDNPIWEEERGLNSLSMLSHLKVAYHITKDEKYQQAYDELIQKHRYLINSIDQKRGFPFEVNHSDDELAFLCYYPVVLYETDPSYRRFWLMSLERSWQIERPERSPFYNFIYGAVTGKPCDVEAAVQTLQEWYWDLRHWRVQNSHRSDIQIDSGKGRFNEAQSVQVLPYNERPIMKWNGNPYRLDGGGDGESEEDAAAFLLPYWMGRYFKIIEE